MRELSRISAALVAVLLFVFAGTAVADDDDDDEKQPGVTALSAVGVTSTGATLRARVDPRGRSTTYVFEYGATTAYGSRTVWGSAGSSDDPVEVSLGVDGLQPGATYHYRAVATNSKGTTRGPDRSFTTLTAPVEDGGPPADPTAPGPATPSGEGESPTGARLGSTVGVSPGSGVVRVRRPGTRSFVRLEVDSELPVGTEIDTRRGAIALTAALPSGEFQTGRFGGGRFQIRQRRNGYVDLHLRGLVCPRGDAQPRARGATIAAAARKRSRRRLWGRDRGGRFRTHGKNSHATVRGTRWSVEDRCAGTLTRVTEGSVLVRDKVKRKRVILEAGERYLARPRR